MAAPDPQTADGIREQRRERRQAGEPLNTESRKVQKVGHSLLIGLTQYGVKTLDVETQDELIVESFPDRIVVRRQEPDR